MDQIRRKLINLDGAEFTISPLTLKQTKALAEESTSTLKVISVSLSRAGQEVSVEQLEDVLDVRSRTALFNEILAFSGLDNKQEGATGEPKASPHTV